MNKAVELPNSLPIGTRIAEFEIREVIGEGGFGIVYLAFDHSLQRTVAVKEYMPSALAARSNDNTVTVRSKRHAEAFSAGLRSFINEARLLAQFDHPALVKVYRFWESHGTAYMAMRYYEGRTFKSVIRDNPELVNEAWLKRLLQPVLGALDVLYAAQILHRDVSPENIMIQPDGQPVLLDFGAARQIVQDMAQSLTVILKPGFAPVEQYADDESMRQGPWTDIYSLSAVMYAAITGKAPPAAVARMLNDPIEPLAISGREGYSTQFLEAIDRGMAVRPEIRPQSIAEFYELLGFDAAAPAAAAPAADGSTPAATEGAADAGATKAASAPSAPAEVAGRRRSRSSRNAEKGAPGSAEASASSSPSASSPFDSGARSSRNKTSKPGKQALPVARSARPSNNVIAGGLCVLALLVAGISWFADGSPVKPAAPEVASAQGQATGSAGSEASASAASASTEAASALAAASTLAAEQLAVAGSSANASAAAGAAPAAAPAASASAAPPAAAATADAPAPTAGTLSIAVQPWATIYVDGVQKGITPPLKKLTLPPGEHEVRLENPNFQPYVQKITVDGKKPVTIKHDFGQ